MKRRIRSVQLAYLKRSRQKIFKKILTGENELFELNHKEFLMIASLYQMNANYLIFFIKLAFKHGAIVVLVSYGFLTAMLGMPMFMLFTFMSSYSKKSYLQFWDCVPLFGGVGYSLAIIRITTELHNVALASANLVFLLHFFNLDMAKSVQNCRYNTENCVKMYPTNTSTKNCSPSDYLLTATQSYTHHVRLNYNLMLPGGVRLNTEWAVMMGITWILILVFAAHGMRYIRRITVIFQMLCGIILFFIAIFVICHIPWSTVHMYRSTKTEEATSFLEASFWVDMILHSAETNVLGNMIWLGTLKPRTLHPKFAAITVSPYKLLVFVLLVCLFSCIIQETVIHYKYENVDCLQLKGTDYLFTLIPDLLFRTRLYNLFVPLWYISLFIFCFLAPLYSIIGLVDSITQKFRILCRYRLYMYCMLGVICFVANVFLSTDVGMEAVRIWMLCGMPPLTSSMLLLLNLAIMFVYSTSEIINDYMFTYGTAPEKYWISLWKTTPIFAIFALIFVFYNQYKDKACAAANTFTTVSYAQSFVALLPIIVILLAKCCRHIKLRSMSFLSRASSDWGPYQKSEKISRELFFPRRDIKYRNPDLKCKHRCVHRNSDRFREKLLEHKRKLRELEYEINQRDLRS